MRPAGAKNITIRDIELHTQSSSGFQIAKQYYIKFSVGDTIQLTKKGKEKKNRTSWDEVFYFDGDDHTIFVTTIHEKHHIRKDQVVGSLTDTIGGILGKLKNGVLEIPLGRDTSDAPEHAGIAIKFTFTAEPHGDVGASELQATDAVNRAMEITTSPGPTPQVVGIDSAISTGVSVVSEIQTFENTWGVLLQRMALFNKIVAGIAEIHPYVSLAWSVISVANQVLVNQQNRDDRIVRLAGKLSDVFTFVQDADPLKKIEAHKETVTSLLQQVTECGYFIAEYAKQKNFWIRTAKYTLANIDGRITDYENKLQDLKTAFLEGVILQSGVIVFRMMNAVQNIAESIDLNDMPYAAGARYVQEKVCLPGTREAIIREICDILNDPAEDAPRVCVLTGVAGSGKSAISHSIAQLYDGQKRLGSSYCFVRSDLAKRNPQNFFSTISRDLADHDPQFKSALWAVVKDNRALRTSVSPSEQIEQLIIGPSKDIHAIGPLIIVVDALDESGEPRDRRQFLNAISNQITERKLPTNVRFLITTRPERDILDTLPPCSQIVYKHIADVPKAMIEEDIRKFIYHSLHWCTELESSWPNREWCRLLVQHSQCLFQWASAACKFIAGDDGTAGLDPRERLDSLLQTDTMDGVYSLDSLYQIILGRLFTTNIAQDRFREVMAVVLSLKEPLSLTSLSTLLGDSLKVRNIIKPLGSLLDGAIDEKKPIRPLHTSFRDFLLDESRSSLFHLNILPHHSLLLGHALLPCMQKMLKFNICDLKDSRLCNTRVPNLRARVSEAIPPYLAYSCQYWMYHMEHAECTPELMDEVTSFFKNFFPFWLEAISLLSLSSPVSYILTSLDTCNMLAKWAKGHEIATLASEASQFIQVFAPVIRESTPHLYLSAMSQTPSSSPLWQLWLNKLQNHLPVTLGQPLSWPANTLTLQGHRDVVGSVCYSPDGKSIVSGSHDKTIRVWNPITGQCVAGPFQGHTAEVASVAYSPDGTHVISGSWDMTIRVWNPITGECVAGPFQGHNNWVTSVAYSPDGRHIVSGSEDRTIMVWDPITGECVGGSFQGHTKGVSSVAYSCDSRQIVSGSDDQTIRVWNPITGQCVAGLFQGHTGMVTSVSCSPNGHIVSGSEDMTIRVWNPTTGQCVAGPFQGHTSRVSSVAYSPDGSYIVSGSWDKTIRVWDPTTGHCVAGPFQGHLKGITSVAYSPDGSHFVTGCWGTVMMVWNLSTGQYGADSLQGHSEWITSVACSPDSRHIVSASQDTTIKIWDSISGQCVVDSFQGHTDEISSVAYSSDGTHVVSGSQDKTIRVWNPLTGQCVAGPFQGHTDAVNSVAYSSDGRYIISGSSDMTIRVWNPTTGECVAGPFEGHTGEVTSVCYSPDGSHVVSGSQDNSIRIWNANTGQCVVGQGHIGGVTSVAYSPDGSYIASGSYDKTIRIWDSLTGQCGGNPILACTDWVISVAYSPDGHHIVSSSWDNTISVWDSVTGQCIAGPVQGHRDKVMSVSYSPDGTYIVSGSHDLAIKVWNSKEVTSFREMYQQGGWVVSSDNACLCWVPPWARNAFYLPFHSLVISPYQTYKLDFSKFLDGESWVSCWK